MLISNSIKTSNLNKLFKLSFGDLYMIWSNSERFPDKIVRGVLQGKDTLYGSLLATKK